MVVGSNPTGGVLVDTFPNTLQYTTTSGFPESGPGKPRSSRRLWQVVVGLAILVVALAVFAWQQGGDGDDGGPLNAIAAAAEKTQDEPGGRALMRSVITTPEHSVPFTMTGRMVYDAEDRTQIVMTAPRTASGGPMKMDGVTDGSAMYMRSSRFGSLPNGAEWMKIDLALGDDQETPAPASVDVKGELALLEGADDVQKLGKEDIRGVPATHYRGTIASADEESSPFHVEAWIDADGVVRRMRLVHSEPSEKEDGTTTVDMRMDFFDFGIEPKIEVPDPSEVFDATAMAEASAASDS
jgi:hypothetical protein